MFCTRCGAEIESGDRFCSRCGNEVPVAEEPALAGPEAAEDPVAAGPAEEQEPAEGQEPAEEPSPVGEAAEPESPEEPAADQDDGAEEAFIGGAASAAAGQAEQAGQPEEPDQPEQPDQSGEPGQAAAAEGYVLPDSAFEPQTQPETPSESSTSPAVQVVAPPLPESAPPEPAPKRKKGPIIAAAAAAVVLVAAVAIGMFFFLHDDETTEEPTRCSLVTLVVPEDENGQPYSRYRATLKDPSGVVLSTLDVEGTEGFKLEDMTTEDGDYILEISDPDTGVVLQQTPIRTDPADTTPTITPQPKKNGSANTASAGTPQGGGASGTEAGGGSDPVPSTQGSTTAGTTESTEKAMSEAYLEVVEQRMDTYGSPNVLWYKDEPNMLSGVCVAELVDFNNDQQDELVVAYYDKAISDQKSTDTWKPEYSVEVYTFNDSKAQRAYTKKVTLATDDPVALDIVQPAGTDMKPMIVERTGTEESQETTYFALEEPDSFKAVSSVSLATDSKGKVTCKVEGKDVTVEEYQEVVNKYEEGCDRTVYRFDVGDQLDEAAAEPEPTSEGSSSATSSSSGSSSSSSGDSSSAGGDAADERPVAPEPANTRVVKCADELASIDDTLATLRSGDQESSSSDAGDSETVATEATAREAIRKAAGTDPAQVFWADFDGDGTFEAFGLVGALYEDEVVAPRGQKISVWFVAKDEAVKVGDDIDNAGVWPSQLQSGDVRFLKLVPDFGGEKGDSQAVYLGVKDGAAIELSADEVNEALK